MPERFAHVSLDEPIEIEPGILLVVELAGAIVGEVRVAADDDPREAIRRELGDRIAREHLRATFLRAARLELTEPGPSVAVAGEAEPDTGEIVAFTGGLTMDPRWLDDLARPFRDPLTMAVKGYVGPGGALHRGVFDCFSKPRPRVERPGNLLARREALEELGGIDDEDAFLDRVIEAGYRVAFDPARIAWTRPPTRSRAPRANRQPPTANREPPAVASEPPPQLSVTIASYNRREALAQLLQALARQDYPADRFEVVVILDGSTDGSAERARALELPYGLRVIEQENRGLAASRNRGGREAHAPVVVFLDDDIMPVPSFLAAHAAAHARLDGGSLVLGSYPPVRRRGESLQELLGRHWWEDYFRRRSEPDHQWSYMDFSDGNVSFPRALLEASGGWDEEFVRERVRRQDWEFGIRLLEQGVRFVDCAEARGAHHFDAAFATAVRNRRVEGAADVLLGSKHPGVRAHQLLARLLSPAGRRLSMRHLFDLAWRSPAAADRLIGAAIPPVSLLERAGRAREWFEATIRLGAFSYVLGVRDVLPTRQQLDEYMAPVRAREGVERRELRLDRPGPLDLPPATGQVELALAWGDAPLATVDAFDPEMQWDWDLLTERAVREASAAFSELPAGLRTPAGAPSP